MAAWGGTRWMWNGVCCFVLLQEVAFAYVKPVDQCQEDEQHCTINPWQPRYNHGFRPPIELPCLSEEEAESAFQHIISLEEYWDVRRPGVEKSLASMPDMMNLFVKLGIKYFTLGAFINYDSTKNEHYRRRQNEMNPIMEKHFEPIYAKVRAALEKQLGEPVEMNDGSLFAFRIYRADILSPEAIPYVTKLHSPPHYDTLWKFQRWPEGFHFNHTISFTLPIRLPKAGSALRIYDVYHRGDSDEWYDGNMNPIPPITTHSWRDLPFRDHEYHVGHLALHSGHELHCIPPAREGIHKNDFRITLQGWGVWGNGKWVLFS